MRDYYPCSMTDELGFMENHMERNAMQEAQHQLEHERQQRILEALDDLRLSVVAAHAWNHNVAALKKDREHLYFLACELGVAEIWAKSHPK